MSNSEIEARRQRAREAGLDATVGMWDGEDLSNGLESAIEAATRVTITGEAIEAFMRDGGLIPRTTILYGLRAALTALGFEVTE